MGLDVIGMGTASASCEQSAHTSELGTVVPERRSVHVGQHLVGVRVGLGLGSGLELGLGFGLGLGLGLGLGFVHGGGSTTRGRRHGYVSSRRSAPCSPAGCGRRGGSRRSAGAPHP